MVLLPFAPEEAAGKEVLYGPNIKAVPTGKPLEDSICAKVLLKVGDNITTDHIMPAGAKILPYRSNVPYLSQFCFGVCDKTFPERAKKEGGGVIVGGANYGQGSSREHAALVPLYLGVKAVAAKSFARMHKANLINSGILPLTLVNPADYDEIGQGDEIELAGIRESVKTGAKAKLIDRTTGKEYLLNTDFSDREIGILLAGGKLNYTAQNKE
jgi:aconitate hydratase